MLGLAGKIAAVTVTRSNRVPGSAMMTEANYAERYSGMSENELMRLIAEKDSLID